MIIDVLAHHVSKSVAEMLETRKYYGEESIYLRDGKELSYPIVNATPRFVCESWRSTASICSFERNGIDPSRV